jgi:hypothetical protein
VSRIAVVIANGADRLRVRVRVQVRVQVRVKLAIRFSDSERVILCRSCCRVLSRQLEFILCLTKHT